jgi:Hemerythrin HHE cation binding domain
MTTAPSALSPLLMEHTHADHEMAALKSAVQAADKPVIRACIGALQRALLQHFDAEEREFFVFYRQREAGEVHRLEEEHAHIRDLLRSAAERAALGTFGPQDLHALKVALTLHEAHEELGIYRWANERSPH